jgi:hypothetical protein
MTIRVSARCAGGHADVVIRKAKNDIHPRSKLILWLRTKKGRNEGPIQSRAIAQAVSRWLPTPAARVRARVWSSGICGGQSGAGAGFLRVLLFPLPIFIPPITPQSPSSIIWGCTIGQKWPQYLVT